MIPAAGEDHFQTVGNQEVTKAFIQTSDTLRDFQVGKLFFNQNNTDIVNLLTPVGALLLLILLPLLIFVLYPAGICVNFIMSQS